MSNIDFSQIVTSEDRKAADRADLLKQLANVRWQRCCEGVTLENGATFPGDENTRSTLAGAVQALQQGMISAPVAWKTPGGFIALSEVEVVAAAAAVVQHIQRCFVAEAAVTGQIAAASDPAGFDVVAAFDAALEAS